MGIPLYNFEKLHHEDFKRELRERMDRLIDDNSFIEGPYNLSFEKKFAKMQSARHALLVANGTDALEISLEALGIGPGKRVGVPAITFWATAEAVLNVGAEVVFIDVQKETGLVDPDSLHRIVKNYHLSALMAVHIYGMPANIDALRDISRQVAIVEDAAQAHGAFIGGKPVGHHGNLTTFSFYPTKNLSAFGDAGCILTHEDHLAERIRQIRNHGRGSSNSLGRNSRCDHIQAAVLDLKLRDIEALNQKRKEVARNYHRRLQFLPTALVPEHYLSTSSWHAYPLFLPDCGTRERLQSFLAKHAIGTAPFYLKALADEKALQGCAGESENARNVAGRVLCLPIHPFIETDEIDFITEKIRQFFKS